MTATNNLPQITGTSREKIDAALTIVGSRLRYWRQRREAHYPHAKAGQVETELGLVAALLAGLRKERA